MKEITILNQKLNVSLELQEYLSQAFKLPEDPFFRKSTDEAQTAFWEGLLGQGDQMPGFGDLKAVFPQFHFPVKKDISQSAEYQAATLKGKNPLSFSSAQGLGLEDENQVEPFLHQSLAGKIPVLSVGNPHDFEVILQALAYKNEPKAIPSSMGAVMINGLRNWKRIDALKRAWENSSQKLPWLLHFRDNIAPNKALFQDKVILLSRKPYSGVTHQQLGISESEWLGHSFSIRLHHECAHYYTQRYLGGMHIHLHDEVLADYMGLVQTMGYFSLDWFLAFFGVEGKNYRPGGRMENYLPPALNSPQNQEAISHVLKAVGRNLLCYHRFLVETERSDELSFQLLSLASHSLAELAGESGGALLKTIHLTLAEASVSADL